MKGLDLMGRIGMVRIDKYCRTIGHLMGVGAHPSEVLCSKVLRPLMLPFVPMLKLLHSIVNNTRIATKQVAFKLDQKRSLLCCCSQIEGRRELILPFASTLNVRMFPLLLDVCRPRRTHHQSALLRNYRFHCYHHVPTY